MLQPNRPSIDDRRAARGTRAGLRVCMVHYSDFHVDSRVQRQAYALADRGDEVDCIGLSDPTRIASGAGVVTVHRVRAHRASAGAGSYLAGYGRFLAEALVKVTTLDRRRRYDVVQVHNMPNVLTFSAIVPKLRGAPVLLDMHDTFLELFATKFQRSLDSRAARAIRWEERLGAALADELITVTAEARDRLAGRSVGVGRTGVVMNSPDERLFGPAREPVPVPEDGPVRLVYHGGLADRFGVRKLIEAVGLLAPRLPRLELVVYGSTTEHAELAELARRHAPDRITVAPRPTPLREIPAKVAACHIGVVPTLADGFTELLLPVKLMEYVHLGMPVVTSRLPVIERYFGDDEVRFARPGSAKGLAEAIAAVVEDPAAAAARARRAGERLREFSWDAQRRAYVAVIDGLAARATAPATRR